MRRRRDLFRTVILSVVPLLLGSTLAPVPGAAQADAVAVVASGLTNPRGFTWDAGGTLYVAHAGIGFAAPHAPLDPDEIPTGSTTAGVARIENGCPVTVVAGLPSGGLPDLGWIFGVSDVEILDDHLYVLVDGGGAVYGHEDRPNGVYRIDTDDTTALVADLSAWVRANPVAQPHEPINPDGEPFAMIAGDGLLWVVEANHQQVLTVTPDGTITRIADLSLLGNVVPSGVALAPEGGVYVSFLSALPFTDGSAKVVRVAPDGDVTDVWTGLTAVTAIAVGPDGALYALEMVTGNSNESPFVSPGTGKVVRQIGFDASEDVVTSLTFPVKMAFGPDGALYVATPAFGANNGEGTITRLDLSSGEVVALTDEAPAEVACAS